MPDLLRCVSCHRDIRTFLATGAAKAPLVNRQALIPDCVQVAKGRSAASLAGALIVAGLRHVARAHREMEVQLVIDVRGQSRDG